LFSFPFSFQFFTRLAAVFAEEVGNRIISLLGVEFRKIAGAVGESGV